MTVSILLRLVPDELARGHLVGRLRVVATGEERVFRNVDELTAMAAAVLRDTRGGVDTPADEDTRSRPTD